MLNISFFWNSKRGECNNYAPTALGEQAVGKTPSISGTFRVWGLFSQCFCLPLSLLWCTVCQQSCSYSSNCCCSSNCDLLQICWNINKYNLITKLKDLLIMKMSKTLTIFEKKVRNNSYRWNGWKDTDSSVPHSFARTSLTIRGCRGIVCAA